MGGKPKSLIDWSSISLARIEAIARGAYLRAAGIPTYGVSGVFLDIDDIRAHGRDERILVRSFYDGVEYIYALVREVGLGH